MSVMKKSLIFLINIAVLVGGIPSPVDIPLSQLPAYYAEKDKTDGVNADTYETYGLPPDFYPALIPSDYAGNPDFYYNANASYLPMMGEEKGCSSVKSCPNHQFDPYAPMYGIEKDDSNASSEFSREWKCHVETNCVALDEVPTDVQNDTEVLFLRYFNVSVLQDDDLSSLPPLLKLHIESSELAVLEQGVFKNQRSLQYLEITGNLIKKLQPMTFLELQKLQSLEVTDNFLMRLERSVFKGLKSLKVLKLGGNKLTKIHDDVFREIPLLQELHLDDNNITSLSRHAFRGLNELTSLYLSQNFFSKVPNLALRDLLSLEVLHLSGNPLTHISKVDFRRLDKLQELRLDQCDIKAISKKAFRGKNLTFLDVSANKLTKLSNFGFVGQKLSMQMAFNPWMCNCSLTATTNWIANYSVSIIPPEPRCHAPFYMERRRITYLTNKQLCDRTATPPPMKHEDEAPWRYFPDDRNTDISLPEGRWSDRVYDIEKLYPGIHSITHITQLPTGKSVTEAGGENRRPITNHTGKNGNIERTVGTAEEVLQTFSRFPTTFDVDVSQTTLQFVDTSSVEPSTTTTTTGVHIRLFTDHIIMVILILGVSIPIFLIVVLILHTSLHKRSSTEKSDIEMPHIESKCAEAKDQPKCQKKSTDGVVHPKSSNDKPSETSNPQKIEREKSTLEDDATNRRSPSSIVKQKMDIPTDDVGQYERDGMVITESSTEENVVTHHNSEKPSDK